MKLAIVIPVFEEAATLGELFARLSAVDPPTIADGSRVERLIVLVDDGSLDTTPELVRRLSDRADVTAVYHKHNRGKGAALRSGFRAALQHGADVVLIQDADLEYDPADHAAVLRPILDGRADAVIGSRFLGSEHRVLYYWHSIANRAVTAFSNAMTNLNLSDIECCYKAFTREVLEQIEIEEDRFGVEPELVAKVAHLRLQDEDGRSRAASVYEVGVSYSGRTYEDGKKITWRDGVAALWHILAYNVWKR